MTLFRVFFSLIAVYVCTSQLTQADESKDLKQLSLIQAQAIFQANNKEVLAAQRMLQGTEADAVSAAQKPNPILSIGVSSLNLNRSNGNKNAVNNSNSLQDQTLNTGVQISQLIERGDKRELRISSSKNAITASQLDVKDVERQLTLTLNSSYYDLLLGQEIESIQMKNVNLYEKTLQAAELRFKAGDVASIDVSRIHVDLLKAKNDLRQAEANRQKAQANLAYLIGQEQYAAAIVAQDRWPDVANSMNQQISKNIDTRADVLAADARTKQAEENQRLASALKTRDVNIALQYQHFPGQMPGSDVNTIGAAITIPLFTNYEYQGEISRAEVDLTAAIEAKERIRAAAATEISRVAADLQAASDKLQRFDSQILTEAEKAANASEFAYNHGAIGITDLLDSRRILRALQLDAASVRADFAKALVTWQAVNKTADEQNNSAKNQAF